MMALPCSVAVLALTLGGRMIVCWAQQAGGCSGGESTVGPFGGERHQRRPARPAHFPRCRRASEAKLAVLVCGRNERRLVVRKLHYFLVMGMSVGSLRSMGRDPVT